MNVYAKVLIVGIIGLTIIGIILGVTSTTITPAFEFPSISTDTLVLLIILQMPADDPMRNTLLILWLLGFFAPAE